MTNQEAKWKFEEIEQVVINKLVKDLNIHPLTAEVLARRGFTTSKEADTFLHFDLEDLYDPYLLLDVKIAAERIKEAVAKQEKIVIYGDYDVDGITSTALLVNVINKLGGNVDCYIPNRLEEGYGLNLEAVEELAQDNTDLIITVDCGIKAHEEIELARELGMEVIVTDHHTPPDNRTAALAVINPKQETCSYPFKELCGAGVAFKLAQTLILEMGIDAENPPLKSQLGLVALGTVADIVPLQEENRIITSYGLKILNQLNNNQQPGLAALVNVAGYGDREIKAGNISYQLAPRINAAGRLGEPEAAVELLLAEDYFTAQELANKLNRMNNERKEISSRIFSEAEEVIRGFDLQEEWVLVIASQNWHSGVIGNVASDLQEKYHRPVVLIALDEDGKGPGSCRSISRFNIYEGLKACKELLIDFGGHKQAAGFSIKEENIKALRNNLNQYAKQVLAKEDLRPRKRVDSKINLTDLSFSLLEELESLAPFGYSNPKPVFRVDELEVDNFKLVGKDNKHLKLYVKDKEKRMEAIAFNLGYFKDKLDLQSKSIDLLFQLDKNEWQGKINLQLKVKDLKVPLQKFEDRLLAREKKERSTEVNQDICEEDWFYLEFKRKKANCSFEVGEQLKLIKENPGQIIVATLSGKEVGTINSKLAEELIARLKLGIKYKATIAKIKEDQVGVFILRQFNGQRQQKKDKYITLSDKELIRKLQQKLAEEGEDVLGNKVLKKLAAEKNTFIYFPLGYSGKLKFYQLFTAWQALKYNRMVVIVVPYKHLINSYCQCFDRQLLEFKWQIWKATSDLTFKQQQELKQKLKAEKVDILFTTPQFINNSRQLINKRRNCLILDSCEKLDLDQVLSKVEPNLVLGTANRFCKVGGNFNFKVNLDFSRLDFTLIDKRDITDKLAYLNSLFNQEKKILIYVNDNESSVKLASQLKQMGVNVLFYNSNLTSKEQKKIEDKFLNNESSNLIATFDFLAAEQIEKLTDIVFYQPGFSKLGFQHRIQQFDKGQIANHLHLVYSDSDLKRVHDRIISWAPGRKLLKELYIILSKLGKGQEEITISNQELYQIWCQNNDQQVCCDTVSLALSIFAELGLLTRIKNIQKKIRLSSRPQNKLDLTSSIRYNECVKEREAFNKFKTSILTASKEQILNSIYSSLQKGEKKIEFK